MSKSNYHKSGKAGRCFFCPTRHDLEEHHIIPQRFGGSDKPQNIVTVCNRCHKKLERLYDKRFYEFFGIEDEKGKRLSHRPCEMNDCDNRATRTASVRRARGFSDPNPLVVCEEHTKQLAKKARVSKDGVTVERLEAGVSEENKEEYT